MRFHRVLIGLGALALSVAGFAQALPTTEIPFQRYFQYPLVNGRSPSSPAMAPNGSKIVFGWNKTGDRKLDLYVVDYPNGEPHMLVSADRIRDLPRQDDTRTAADKKEADLLDGGIAGATWSPDSKKLMFSYKGRVWLMNADATELEPIIDANAGISGAQFSPDGKYVSYVQGSNVYRFERKTNKVKQLTFVSKPGASIDGHTWSPDGKSIAISWSDSSKMGSHQMMDFTKDRAVVVPIRRMWNGELSNDVQIGMIPADGGLIKFVEGLPRYMWVKDIVWSPDSKAFAIAWIKDDFKEFTISTVAVETVKKADVYHEKAPKNYIPDWRPIEWTRESDGIYLGTDILDGKFGFRSIVKIDPDGKNLKKVYAEKHDVVALGRPKNADELVLVTMAKSPLKSEITIVDVKGGRHSYTVMQNGMSTPKNFDDAALPLFSDDGEKIATLASDRTLNAELYGVKPVQGRITKSQTALYQRIKWADVQEVTFAAPDGATIHGLLFTKKGLDKSKRHPAFISNIYANSGKAAWGGFLENFAAQELDMVVLAVDFRASWGYGGEFNSGYYRKMGLIDVDEAVAAKNYLAGLAYVRGDRVGIWGWSYGGYLTCMTLLTKPGVFHTGVAVASVTDWKSYNEWYTRRRLGLVKDDPKIFEETSPISYPTKLSDNLLLVHGMLDDNVLFQDTVRLEQKLIENNRQFDLATYPRDDHSIGRPESRPHVFERIMRYLYWHLSQP